jgi:hypothetical protein
MKLSEIKGKDAIRTLANLMEPVAKIAGDAKLQESVKAKKPKPLIAKELLETWPDEVIEILALLDGADPKTYEVNLLTLPMKLLEVLNDPEINALFFS